MYILWQIDFVFYCNFEDYRQIIRGNIIFKIIRKKDSSKPEFITV